MLELQEQQDRQAKAEEEEQRKLVEAREAAIRYEMTKALENTEERALE